MLFDGLTVVANPRRLLSEPSFKAFVSPIVDERGTFGEGQDLEAVIMEVRERENEKLRLVVLAVCTFVVWHDVSPRVYGPCRCLCLGLTIGYLSLSLVSGL